MAIGLSELWKSLDTERVRHPQLVELWLRRARALPLSLRIAPPVAQHSAYFPPFHHWQSRPPLLVHPSDYEFPMPRHMCLTLPRIPQCRMLEMVDFMVPHFVDPQAFKGPLNLEVLSVVVRAENSQAADWFSRLLVNVPRLKALHWRGPMISAPWSQLTQLSLDVDHMEPEDVAQILNQITVVAQLHLSLNKRDRLALFASPRSSHIMPTVVTFSICGDTAITRSLSMPQLKELVIVWSCPSSLSDIGELLRRSGCNLSSLELWEDQFTDTSPALLNLPAITLSLTLLLISSQDLNAFFLELESAAPGSLPQSLMMLRDVDRCFRIEDLPGVIDASTSGFLGPLISAHFARLEQLYIYDNNPTTVDLESRPSAGRRFTVWRSSSMRHAYELWWNSLDGDAFRAARARDEDLGRGMEDNGRAAKLFHIDFDTVRRRWEVIHTNWWRVSPGPGTYANTSRVGYVEE
ncbi:hypothetical protein C8R46DRAFT_1208308 [Mycena filopes]|nr:hypothetical protein C8R46DRAFT_1208308 [Mycena filopes]